ncbi:transcription regulator protein BACH1-like isoform X2 [Channa argus]|uniref:transcription regulator protein BACH1-like isoform X2 n=1 Tax=Channa argus TaxID=215402 RepID=UPI0035226868
MLQWWRRVRVSEPTAQYWLPAVSTSHTGYPPSLNMERSSLCQKRKTCCKRKCKRRLSKEDCNIESDYVLLDQKEVKPVADSPSQQEVARLCSKSVNNKTGSLNSTDTLPPAAEGTTNLFMQCPKYRKFQMACGKESCFTIQKSLHNPGTVIRDPFDLSCMPSSSGANSKNETEAEHPGNSPRQSKEGADPLKTEICDKSTEERPVEVQERRGEAHVVMKDKREETGDEKKRETSIVRTEEGMKHTAGFSSSERSHVNAVSMGSSIVQDGRSPGLILPQCPQRACVEPGSAITRSPGQETSVIDIIGDTNARDSGVLEPGSIDQRAGEQEEGEGQGADNTIQERGQTGSMERASLQVNNATEMNAIESEGAKNLAKQLDSDVGSNFQDPDVGSSSDTGSERLQSTSLEWLKCVSSSTTRCPFFQDLDQSKCSWKGAGLSECEGGSQSGLSSLNSGEDGDSETETEGDSESYARERAKKVQLPFSVNWIVNLSRNDFQQLLKQQVFNQEQLDFVHDMRRRSKNRLAAQRCRKRKLDCLYNLQCEINKLKTEKEKLVIEKSQLNQLKLKTCHSVSVLCQRVCNEANLQPEHLQVLAKYTSPDCPLASFFPYIDMLSQPDQPESSFSPCSVGRSGQDLF